MKYLYQKNDDFIRLLIKGDEKAYVFLVETYHRPLFVYALSLIKDKEQAEDIVQTVFIKIWETKKRLNPDSSIKSLLYKITYNEFINQYHKNRAVSTLERLYIDAIDETIEEGSRELLEKKIALITEEISRLPRKCKETFLLSKKEGLTNLEIAEYLNISLKTVEGQLTKAYHILREKVGGKIKNILFILLGIRRPSNS